MDLGLKSLAYFFVSRGYEIYLDEDDPETILISRLVCKKCGHPWYMDLTECFFCGMVNSYTAECRRCGRLYSITNASKACIQCHEKLFFTCRNPECPSNKDSIIESACNEHYKGVFDRSCPFSTALEHCINCGYDVNQYNEINIYLAEISETVGVKSGSAEVIKMNDIKPNLRSKFSHQEKGILIVKSRTKEKVLYSTNAMSKVRLDDNTITLDTFKGFIDLDVINRAMKSG